jgi:hypothetical protein
MARDGQETKAEVAEEINELLGDALSQRTEWILAQKLSIKELRQIREDLLAAKPWRPPRG